MSTVFWILFVITAFIGGGTVGILTMALLSASRETDDYPVGVETDAPPKEGR